MTDLSSELVGQELAGRYRIIAKLGEGAMGAVYLGEHMRIGRRDAIKVLRTGMARDPEAIARFTRGARNVSSIKHPNVCTIYDFSDTADGLQFLAMEFVEGETLKDVLDREGRLSVQRAVEIARQVAHALQAAHDVGIVHRDLKPGNIMLTRKADGSESVKVVDFDIAKGPEETLGDEVTRLGFVVGTPEYMSPEQLMGERLDGRSDVYSLAIVLFRMLTGTLPFRAASTQDIMVQRLTTDPLKLADALPSVVFPAALEELLRRGLARRVIDRTGSAAEFARGLTGHTPAPVTELPATRVVTAVTKDDLVITENDSGAALPIWRRPIVMAAAGVVLVVGLGATVLLRDRQPDDPPVTEASIRIPDATSSTLSELETAAGNQLVDETVADTSRTVDVPADPNRQRVEAQRWSSGALEAMLNRQLETVGASPSSAQLRAVQDSGNFAWSAAATNRDKAAAALVLAQAALAAGNLEECARWTNRGVALNRAGFDMLLQVCR